MNIYGDGDDTTDILIAKNWLTKPKKPPLESAVPVKANLEEIPRLLTSKSLASEPQPEYLSKIQQLEEQLTTKDEKIKHLESELAQAKEQNTNLQNDLANLSQQNNTLHQAKNQAISENHQLQQNLTQSQETISQLTQELTNEREQRITVESDLSLVKAFNKDLQNNLTQERQVSTKQKLTIYNLNQQFQVLQEINANLTQQISNQEQNHTNLLNTFQKTLKDKEKTEILAQNEKTRADYYQQQLKSIAKIFYQRQKINYY